MVKTKAYYITKQQLEDEIIASKAIRKQHPDWTVAQCFTPKLTEYIQILVNKYSNKGQWRNYCVDESTDALTQRGWLGIDQINEYDTILSCHDGQLTWSSIKSIYRSDYSGHMFHLTVQGLDSLITPGHKFLTNDGLKPVEHLRERDQLILLGSAVRCPTETHEDAFVELIGWVVTEGNYYRDPSRTYCRISISQNEGIKAQRIRNCLTDLKVRYGEAHSEHNSGKPFVCFHLSKDICDQIIEVVPEKKPTMNFILSLSQSQRELLIDTMVAADGWVSYGKYRNFGQVDKEHIDVFLALCTIAGYQTSVKLHDPVGYGKKPFYKVQIFSDTNHKTMVENVDFHGGKNTNRIIGQPKETYPNEPTVSYEGRVWCPQTEFGSFVARRNEYIYLTGNSYLDDMKSDAIMTLCQNIFKYDETRFNNPFGYATQIIKYCFITFLEKEEIIRDIKDSLWESIGMTPSYARQIKNEMLKDVPDQSSKAVKVLKKDGEILHAKIDMLSLLINRVGRIDEPDMEIDYEIADILEMDIQGFTSHLGSALSLFTKPPQFEIERDIEISGDRVTCLSLKDESTNSHTKRVLKDVNDIAITLALCSIALTIRRDLLVKRLREISGYNLSNTRIPTAERTILIDYETDEPRAHLQLPDQLIPNTSKRRGRRRND